MTISKKPYQLSQSSFISKVYCGDIVVCHTDGRTVPKHNKSAAEHYGKVAHSNVVEKALESGLGVPDYVSEEYPVLMDKIQTKGR